MARRKARTRTDSAKQPRHKPRFDDWANVLTGLGMAGRDKRMGTRLLVRDLPYSEAEALYEGDDMAAKIVDDPAREMIRRWIDLAVITKRGTTDKKIAEAIGAQLEELNVQEKLFDALRWERAFGGSAIIPFIDDGVIDQAKPLRENSIRAVRGISVLDCSELYPGTYYSDSHDPKFGEVETYVITQWSPGTASRIGARVHESRVIKFPGIQVSKRHAARRNGWGNSVFVRILMVLEDFGTAWAGTGHLVQDFSQAIFRIRGLAEAMAAGREDLIRKRIEAIELGRSVVRAALLDAGDAEGSDPGESFERKTTPITGLPELLDRFASRLAAAAEMPVSRLFGDAPGGLNVTDESGVTWWTERIEGLQQSKLRRPLERLVKFLLLAKEGPTKGKEPENWSVSFRPLRQLTPLEEVDRRLKVAQADAAWIGAQVLLPEEVAESRFSGDEFSAETVIDMELRKRMEELPEPPEDDEPVDPGGHDDLPEDESPDESEPEEP